MNRIGIGLALGPLAVLVLLLAVRPVEARQVVRVQLPDSVQAEAGGVVSALARVTADSDAAARIRMDAELPDGWSLLIPIPRLDLPAGGTRRQLISLQVPSSAVSGAYPIRFRIREDDATAEQDIAMVVMVAARHQLLVEVLASQERVRAGAAMELRFSVENQGNTATRVTLVPTSSLGYQHEADPRTVWLGPRERSEIGVSVRTRDDVVSELTHVTGLTATDESGASARASATTRVLPIRRSGAGVAEGRIPATILFSGISEDGVGQQGQVEIEVPATKIGDRVVSALARVPDIRSASTYGRRDAFSLSVEQARTSVRLGDQTFLVSDLLDTASLGFGAEAAYAAGRIEASAFAARTRHLFPATDRLGGRLALRTSRRTRLEVSTLVRGQFEPGEAVSLAASWEPVSGSTLRAEVASGWYEAGRGDAVLVTAQGGSSRSTYSIRAEHAGPDFLGGIQNADRLQAGFSLSAGPWFRLQGQGSASRRYFERPGSDRAVMDTRLARLGTGGSWTLGGRRIQAMVYGQHQARTVDETGLDRQEVRAFARLGYNQRGLGLNLGLETGRIDDPLFSETNFRSAQGSLFRSRGSWTTSLSMSLSDGPSFYSPVVQRRSTVGGSVSYDAGRSVRANVSLFRSTESARVDQRFTLVDAWLARTVWGGHEVELRMRTSETSVGTDVRRSSIALSYRIPFSIPGPVPGGGAQRSVEVIFLDTRDGSPLEGVEVSLGDQRLVSDVDGKVVVRVGRTDEAWLQLAPASIGLERLPTIDFPLLITDDMDVLTVGVVERATLTVRVTGPEGRAAGANAALAAALGTDAVAGRVVEARSGQRRIRRLTDRTGQVTFPPLVPGSWSVFLVESTLPDGYRADPDTLSTELAPGRTTEVTLGMRPKQRAIQFVSSGTGLSLGAPRPVAASSEDASAQPPDAPDVAPDAAPDGMMDTIAVRPGDTLSSLARAQYGSTLHWIRIWEANRDRVSDPAIIRPGQELRLPPAGPLTPAERAALLRLP